jgi:hypothetical protein
LRFAQWPSALTHSFVTVKSLLVRLWPFSDTPNAKAMNAGNLRVFIRCSHTGFQSLLFIKPHGTCYRELRDPITHQPRRIILNTEALIAELEEQRDRLNRAIAALNGSRQATGNSATRKGRRRLSAAARKRISEAQKQRWTRQKSKG